MSLQAIIRWLIPRDDKFFSLMEKQAAVAADVAMVMLRLPLGNGAGRQALDEVHQLEHTGDELLHQVHIALDETFVTPIDREDIHSLANQLDNVTDQLYRAGQALVTYDIQQKTPAMAGMLECLAEATVVLRDTLPLLRLHKVAEIGPARQKISAIEERGDHYYRNEMAALYRNAAVDAKELLRQQAVLDALEAAIDYCQDAADVLETIAVKNA